jgi:parallel beta-helix repeat protein
MSNLGPQHINLSFGGLLQLPNGASGSLATVQDGAGNATALQVSTTAVDFPIESPTGGASGMISDLATDAGSSFVGFEQAGTGAVTRSVQDKARETVSVTDFGVIGSGLDETVAFQKALDTGAKKVEVPENVTVGITSVSLAANQTLEINGIVKKLSGSSPAITMNNLSKIIGCGQIDGNSVANADAIYASAKSDLIVAGVYIHHVGGKGISLASSTKYRITNNRIENITGQAINLDFADSGSVANNYIDTALHGVQFWGGDGSGGDPGTRTYDISITGNVVKNTTGGIWGSCGQRVAVTGNTVTICSDVGIDFECSNYCTASGNTVSKCNNGGLSLFYASTYCVFDGNTVLVDALTGNRYGIWYTAHANNYNIVSNNTIKVSTTGYPIYLDEGGQFNVVGNNSINGFGSVSSASCNVRLLRQKQMTFVNNSLIDSKLRVEGSIECLISGNRIYRSSATDAASQSDSPLYIYWSDSTWNAQGNTVINNSIQEWSYPIVDDCWGDNYSINDCSYNRVSGTMYHRGTSGWQGRMLNNVTQANPNTAATVASY